ncbi:hypothetical protein ACRAWF_11870 [Streptomyces sp. L7]
MGLAGELEVGEGDIGAVADRDGQEEEQEDQGGGEGEELGEDAAEGAVVVAGVWRLVRGLSGAGPGADFVASGPAACRGAVVTSG